MVTTGLGIANGRGWGICIDWPAVSKYSWNEPTRSADIPFMLRRLLFLVLVLPYFLPQGVCICDLVQTCDACTVSEEPAPRRCCGCHKHKHAVPAQSEQASALRSAHTCHHGTPGKTPEHVPCCPAKTGTPLVKQTSTPLTGLAVLGFDGPFTVVPAAVPTCSSDTAGLLVAVGQPLYLSLLQLRI